MLSEGICYHSKRFIFLKMNIGIKKAQLTDWVKVGIALCLFFSSFSAGAGVTKYLKPQETIIVISDKPDPLEKKSALILNYWLKKIYRTDSGFVMKRESLINPKDDEVLIAIGKTQFTAAYSLSNLEPYSFFMKRQKNILSIVGETPLGTYLGAGYFLDRFCGVRFYLPDALFTSMPENKKVNLSKVISVIQIPFAKYAMSTGYRTGAEIDWANINGLSRKDWGSHQHSMGDRFYDDSIFKLYPEIFPIINGKKYFPKSRGDQKWEPDFAEPELVDAAIYSAIKYFKQNPKVNYISFSVQDSWVYPTEGKMGDYLKNYPNTKAGKYRGYTDAYISFLNNLAERLKTELPLNGISWPKTIVYIVYGNVRVIPSVKLNPAILPITVYHLSDAIIDSVYVDNGAISAWAKVTKRIGNDDWAEGRGFIYPRIYTKIVSNYLKAVQKEKLSFDYAHLEFYPNWSMDGPKYYFMGKIYWNPKVNTDSLLTLFCSDMFGKAAKEMKTYFSVLENLNTSMNNYSKIDRKIGSYSTQLVLYENQLALVQQARKSIDKAYSFAAKNDQKKRIKLFSDGFKISEDFFDLYNSKTLDTAKMRDLKDYLKNEIAGNPMMLNIATDKNFLPLMDNLIDQIVKKKMMIKGSSERE